MNSRDIQVMNYPALTAVTVLVVIVLIMVAITVVLRRYSTDTTFLSPRFILALIIIFAFVGLTSYSSVFPLPESEPAGQMVGALIAAFTIVITSFFHPSDERPNPGAHN